MGVLQENLSMFLEGTVETLYMTGMSTILAYVFGLPLGILVIITRQDGLSPHPKLNTTSNVLSSATFTYNSFFNFCHVLFYLLSPISFYPR